MFVISLFKVTKSHQKAMSKVWTTFAVVKIIKIFFIIRLRLHKGRPSPAIICLCLWFSSICFSEIFQNFHNLWKLSSQTFKSLQKWWLQMQFPCYLQFYVFFLHLIFGLMNFQQALGRAQICLMVQQILGNSTEGNAINLTGKVFFSLSQSIM